MRHFLSTIVLAATLINPALAGDVAVPNTQEKLDALKTKFSASAPEKKKSDFEKGIELVRTSGVMEKAKNVGDKAPNFVLPNALSKPVELNALLKDGPVVLVWYRGGWCPYCNIALNDLQQVLPQFKAAGAQLVAISPELPDNSVSTTKKNDLEFTVLSDVGNKVGKEFGVVYELPDFIADYYNDAFDLVKYNGDESNELPLSASYVIAQDGTISYAFLDADYRNRAEPSALLEAVERLK